MFEVTAEDVALLGDEDLRSLVGRLCESELRRRGILPSYVTWGGNQKAADGGLDVRVALPRDMDTEGFIPRRDTGFQVKSEDVPPAKVLSEMRPYGILRPAIRELAEKSGAYIIVSSKGSTSDVALENRRTAMANAVSDLPSRDALALDFYDRRRLETWLRDHPGQVPWVREIIGKPLQGWSSFGAWSFVPEGVTSEYLLDDQIRIRAGGQAKEPRLSAVAGIERIRRTLRSARGVVRLAGLSGVGKTRFAQALFDERVGQNSLDPWIAVYTNLGDSPVPQPLAVASELIVGRKRAILVVDNCPPELHRRLSELCRAAESILSVLTIEYDIREDQPEGTDVFVLEPASTDVIEKLVRHRFGNVSRVDARRIADFSGGNARIALALAGAIGENETIAQLSDEELFARLFQQRHQPDEALLHAAQALSLVYSFQGENVSDDETAELSPIGSLIGQNAREMFKHCAELERRGLLQRRGIWRAVLPPAIANRLASMALQNIPPSAIEECFHSGGRERLLKSFSRRLGHLNSSSEARSIATKWLSPGGLLARVPEFSDSEREMFRNVAPVVPEKTLAALQRVLLESKDPEIATECGRYLRLLRSLAYDAEMFDRCIALIQKVAEAAKVDHDVNKAQETFASLFPICFSGTRASIEKRLGVTKPLLLSDDPKKRTLGFAALKAALETSNFGPGWDFEFGAHSRDYGYWPRTKAEVTRWFNQALGLAQEIACTGGSAAATVRGLIAQNFRGLWNAAEYDGLERACLEIAKLGFWSEGWIAVRQTIHYDSGGFTPEISSRIASLEAALRPKGLVQKVRSIVLPEALIYTGVDSTVDGTTDVMKTLEQVEAVAHDLGMAVAVDRNAFIELLPELVAGNSQQLGSFGSGLAEGAEDRRAIWGQLITQLAVTPDSEQRIQVIRGFLGAVNTTEIILAGSLLDEAVESDTLGFWYPVLQVGIGLDRVGLDRLMRSLDVGKAPIRAYHSLVSGGVTHKISGRDFNDLLQKIATKPGGVDISIDILCMRLSFAQAQSSTLELVDIGCELLRKLPFIRRNDVDNHRLGIVGRTCLLGEKGAAAAREICHNLRQAVLKSETYGFYHGELLQVLLSAQPLATLEALCGGDPTDLRLGLNILDQAAQLQRNPFDAIPEADLLAWCDRQPDTRYPAVAAGVTPFQWSGESGGQQWTSIARKLLQRAPDRVALLRQFVSKFSPPGWLNADPAGGETNSKLLDELAEYTDPALVEYIANVRIRIADVAKAAPDVESSVDRDIDERFE